MAIISMKRKLSADWAKIVIGVAAIVLVGAIAVQFGDREKPVPPSLDRTQVATSAPVQAPIEKSSTPSSLPAPSQPVSPRNVAATKSSEIDALTRSGKAEDAYAAYKLIADCVRKREAGYAQAVSESDMPAEAKAALPKADSVCGDISAAQLASAHLLIERAAKAGLPGAAVDMLNYGPDGRRVDEIWGDPAYSSWRDEVWGLVVAAGRRGDQQALGALQASYENGLQGNDPAKALMYWTASVDAWAAEQTYTPERLKRMNESAIQKFKAMGLNSDQIAAAIQAGHQFKQQP